MLEQETVNHMMEQLERYECFSEIIPISVKTNFNIDSVLLNLYEGLEIGPHYYDAKQTSDYPEQFIFAEIIREKILASTSEEIPHSVAVVIKEINESKKILNIRADIMVERNSQKGIIIGAGGAKLQQIGAKSRIELEKRLETKIFLELHVKVMDK